MNHNRTNGFRQFAARSRLLKSSYHSLRSWCMSSAYRISPVMLARLRYRSAWGRWPDFDKPKTFDEKLLWLMLYWKHPLKSKCGDKYEMRSYVKEHDLEHVLAPMFGVFDHAAAINFKELPERFVLKCSHGCKCNVFCKSKTELDIAKSVRDLSAWLKIDFSRLLGEVHYEAMQPRIICEEFLSDDSGDELPSDYKLLCFHGKVHSTMACQQRDANGKPKLDFYDKAWTQRLPYATTDIRADRYIPPPAAYAEMIEVGERLAKPFPFVRMDFYSIRGRAILGEMTFTPGACVSADYMTEQAQVQMGKLIRLPEAL